MSSPFGYGDPYVSKLNQGSQSYTGTPGAMQSSPKDQYLGGNAPVGQGPYTQQNPFRLDFSTEGIKPFELGQSIQRDPNWSPFDVTKNKGPNQVVTNYADLFRNNPYQNILNEITKIKGGTVNPGGFSKGNTLSMSGAPLTDKDFAPVANSIPDMSRFFAPIGNSINLRGIMEQKRREQEALNAQRQGMMGSYVLDQLKGLDQNQIKGLAGAMPVKDYFQDAYTQLASIYQNPQAASYLGSDLDTQQKQLESAYGYLLDTMGQYFLL